MSRFFLKSFEVGGLNYQLSDVSLGLANRSRCRLGELIHEIAELDGRFRFETEEESHRFSSTRLKRVSWLNKPEISFFPRNQRYYELESYQDDEKSTDFRYTIADQFGQTIVSQTDSENPIFSSEGPMVESGFSVRIDLVSFSNPLSASMPILARTANRPIDWMLESSLIMDL